VESQQTRKTSDRWKRSDRRVANICSPAKRLVPREIGSTGCPGRKRDGKEEGRKNEGRKNEGRKNEGRKNEGPRRSFLLGPWNCDARPMKDQGQAS